MKSKKINKKNITLNKILFNDKALILLSLIFAVIIWIATSISVGATESKTIKIEVPISLGDQVSDQLGMQYYSLQDTVELTVTVTGEKYVVGQVSQDDLNVKFDTSNVSKTGDQTIPIIVTDGSRTLDFTVSSYYPTTVQGYFDVDETKNFTIVTSIPDNIVADGYTIGDPVIDDNEVVISGPKTYVDRIEQVNVDVTAPSSKLVTEQFSGKYDINVVGSNIEYNYLNIALSSNPDKQVKNVSVTVPVLKVVTLPVTVDFDNKPAGVSNDILNVRYSTSSIKVGMIDSLNIKEVSIGTIDFNDISTGTNTFELDLKDLKGVTLLDDSVDSITVTVTVDSSEYASKYLNISNSQITVQGLADDETAKITQIVGSSVSIIGPTDKIDSYSASDITLTCNVENRNSDNVYDVIAVIKKTDSWVYCTCKAEIEITKK